MVCRLIALDKKPGVQPIGTGETVHYVIAKAVLSVIGEDFSLLLVLCSSVQANLQEVKLQFIQ